MELAIKYLPIDKIKPYENNPRKNDEAVKYVAESIKQFGFKNPVILDKNNVIVAGHTRLKAAEELDIKEVPCIYADDLSDDQIKAFRLADNKVAEIAEWDFGKLEEELADIDIDMSEFGFDVNIFIEQAENENTDNIYTSKVDIPQYEPSGENITLEECLNEEKYQSLVNNIKSSDVTEKEKTFLIMAAARHLQFNYKKIADYYASKANKQMQTLMEESALVIIDYNDAIKNGYAILRKTVTDLMKEDGYEA